MKISGLKENYELLYLDNGLPIVIQTDRKARVAHLAVFLKSGSRLDPADGCGMAHFIEHMIFKGTTNMPSSQILSYVDEVGGDLNAYTTKEETCLHVSLPNQYWLRALKLLAELSQEATFPENEIAKEKEVVLDEIRSTLDNPGEQILDDFEDQLLEGHALGRPILGTIESIPLLKREELIRFYSNHFKHGQKVLCYSGPESSKKVLSQFNKHFGLLTIKQSNFEIAPIDYKIKQINKDLDYNQCHLMLGGLACDQFSNDRYALGLLLSILGGPAMNTLLNIAIREKEGLTYSLYAGLNSYADSGLWYIYAGCDPEERSRCLKLIKKEVLKLAEKPLNSSKVEKFKLQYLGQMIVGQENKMSQIQGLGKSMLIYDKIEPIDEIVEKIKAITADDLYKMAQKYLLPEASELIYV